MLIVLQQVLHQNINARFEGNTKQQSESRCWICLSPFIAQHLTGSSCGKRIGSWLLHHNSAMNAILKLRPRVHWSVGGVAGAGVVEKLIVRENTVPYIHLCHVANKRLVCLEASSNGILLLSDDGGTSGTYRAARIQTCVSGYGHTILVEPIFSVGVGPCKADVVPFSVLKTRTRIPFERGNILINIIMWQKK